MVASHISNSDGFRDMLKSVSDNGHTIEECKKYLKERA
jgi:hypothetical protein